MTTAPRTDEAATRTGALLRHFADLRDSSHGVSAVTREEKETLFVETVALLAPHAHEVLTALNTGLLLETGTVDTTGTVRGADGGLHAAWTLSWPEQRGRRGIDPVQLIATYGGGFHHPHLRGGTVGEWPLNVFNEAQAAAERPVLAAIAEAEIHNLVFASDYRIVPATNAHRPRVGTGFVR